MFSFTCMRRFVVRDGQVVEFEEYSDTALLVEETGSSSVDSSPSSSEDEEDEEAEGRAREIESVKAA
jgi:hypothetical protein